MPMQAFVDDSGNKGQHKWFVLAGGIASMEEWAAFSDDWQRCLDSAPRIAYFKLNEAKGRRKGEFRNWSAALRDEKVRQLARIIRRHSPLGIYYAVELDAH